MDAGNDTIFGPDNSAAGMRWALAESGPEQAADVVLANAMLSTPLTLPDTVDAAVGGTRGCRGRLLDEKGRR